MASQDPDVWQILDQSEVLARIKREKNKLSLTLLLIAAAYYATLLLGPTSLKVFFSLPLAGELNIGTVFAISQYPFCGLLAWFYLHKMRSVDRQVANLVKQFHRGEL
ncbi:hypothetical protein PS900_03585 [Pseudomonas fluorescens]|uniref:DUF485 domain-containing protein n=1 Tax=Pseudomonas fluorescens TaxID=294 RepID=A0A8H2NTS6_PSEFL|nr:DUF485 domain-containing protein [Pseudomonas fluorescens]VVP15781.1 hypothetical protein PS900_03585 [Pseudomonas fluorescens]